MIHANSRCYNRAMKNYGNNTPVMSFQLILTFNCVFGGGSKFSQVGLRTAIKFDPMGPIAIFGRVGVKFGMHVRLCSPGLPYPDHHNGCRP